MYWTNQQWSLYSSVCVRVCFRPRPINYSESDWKWWRCFVWHEPVKQTNTQGERQWQCATLLSFFISHRPSPAISFSVSAPLSVIVTTNLIVVVKVLYLKAVHIFDAELYFTQCQLTNEVGFCPSPPPPSLSLSLSLCWSISLLAHLFSYH